MSTPTANPYQSPSGVSSLERRPSARLPLAGLGAGLGLFVLGFSVVYAPLLYFLLGVHSDLWMGKGQVLWCWVQGLLIAVAIALVLVAPVLIGLNRIRLLAPSSVILVGCGLIGILGQWIVWTGNGLAVDFPTIEGGVAGVTRAAAFAEFAVPLGVGCGLCAWWVHRVHKRAAG